MDDTCHTTIMQMLAEKTRRFKKKKSKIPSEPGPIGSSGWSIRYDYKLGVICETRKEYELALGYYGAAYTAILELLVISFTEGLSREIPATLKIGNERWREVKRWLDEISYRVHSFTPVWAISMR